MEGHRLWRRKTGPTRRDSKQYLGQQREKYEVLGETVVIKYIKGKEKRNIPASRSFEGRTNSKDLIFFPVLKLRLNVRNKVLKVRSVQQ